MFKKIKDKRKAKKRYRLKLALMLYEYDDLVRRVSFLESELKKKGLVNIYGLEDFKNNN